MSSRGVLYFAWGEIAPVLERALSSLRKWHPDIPVHVEHLPEGSTFLDKAKMFEKSPFDVTAYLDADTVVMGSLDYAFEKAEQHGLACCVCESPWGRRYESLNGDVQEYNAGVLFFDKLKSKPLFEAWRSCVDKIDSSVLFHGRGGKLTRQVLNDQAGLAKAIEDTGFNPFILSQNWNFRPKWHQTLVGPVKIWHDYADPPDELVEHSVKTANERILDLIRFDVHDECADEVDPRKLKVACAMSVPRLGFQDNFFCWVNALAPLGIMPHKFEGAFWGQCLERTMSDQLDADFILTVDYDSVFTKADVEHLLYLAASVPEADAIAPIQCRRGTGTPLVTFRGADGKFLSGISREALSAELTQCESAHFGLTLLRTSALRKMPHPWFLGVPGSDGTWGEDHVDDDVYFWRKWKETGNKVFLANRVAIGHVQAMVTWPDQNMDPLYQYPPDFSKSGKPSGAWE